MNDFDYKKLKYNILFDSDEFRELQTKESRIENYITEDDLARAVASISKSIALRTGHDMELCEVLALASYVSDSRKSDDTIRTLEKMSSQPIPKEFLDFLKELDNDNIENIDSNEARIVFLANRILEDISLLSEKEVDSLGGPAIEVVMIDQIVVNEGTGKIEGNNYFAKMEKVLDKRKKKLELDERVKKDKEIEEK